MNRPRSMKQEMAGMDNEQLKRQAFLFSKMDDKDLQKYIDQMKEVNPMFKHVTPAQLKQIGPQLKNLDDN